MLTLSGCAMELSASDKTLMEQYPNCVNRENFLRVKQPDNNCIAIVKLKEQAQAREAEILRRNVEKDLVLKKQMAERDKWEEANRKQEIIEAEEIAKFNSLPGLTYDDFIAKVIENPDDIGWSTKVKTRYGKKPPFMPVVKQQIGINSYIVQSMFARDDPHRVFTDHQGQLLLVNSIYTLIEGMPINFPHTLRYDGITTVNTVLGAPKQVIAVILTKATK